MFGAQRRSFALCGWTLEMIMTNKLPSGRTAALIFAALAAAAPLAACNQPAQTTASSVAVPPPPAPPAVPATGRSPDQQARWDRYMALKAAYEEQVAQAHREGRQEQAAADAGRQAVAFDAGRHDQAGVDQARQQLAQAEQSAKHDPDPRHRDQTINQAKANLAAAQAH